MALRNQPYIPLYVNDFLTDEKLIECNAESTGVYIRLMCLMHKSEQYGNINLKEKDMKTEDNVENFANKISRLMPYSKEVIKRALNELIEEEVILLKDNCLIQSRMVADNSLSITRSKSGKKGGLANKHKGKFAIAKVKAKPQANTEYEYVIVNDNNYYNNKELNSIFIEYLNMRKKLKMINSDRAINTLMNKLSNYDDQTKYKMIEQSIVKSWKSVYEVKEEALPEWFNNSPAEEHLTEAEEQQMKERLKKFK